MNWDHSFWHKSFSVGQYPLISHSGLCCSGHGFSCLRETTARMFNQDLNWKSVVIWLSHVVPIDTPMHPKSWLTSTRHQICLVFVWPKPKLHEQSDVVTVWCLGSSRSLLRRFCLPKRTRLLHSKGIGHDRMTTMDVLKKTKAYTWDLKQSTSNQAERVIASVFLR